MQNLSLDQILENISNEVCFEATFNGDFFIKIQEYVPYVCAAIHDGHRLRSSLEAYCLLSEEERYYEEDPFTAEFIKSLPITIIGGDSRYEYDLNRAKSECIYDIAWSKKVWNTKLPADETKQSLKKHYNFYKVVYGLVSKLEEMFKSAVVYDIHSYNYKRHDVTFLFNLGIENIDIKRYNSELSHWKRQLAGVKLQRYKSDVSVNHIFYGRGYLLQFIKENFDNTLVLATEVKKVFMDEETGVPYPLIIQKVAKELKKAIVANSTHYINSRSNINISKRAKLLNSYLQPELLKLDKKLHRLVKNFEVLGYVNPTNIESEKKKFFSKKFNYNPEFRYKPLTIDPHTFKSKMYSLDADSLEDIHIRQIYMDIIKSYADKVDLIASIGTENFLYNSLRYFGEPSEKDIANANFLLYCNELEQFQDEEYLSQQEVIDSFKNEASYYGFDFKVEVVNNIPSDAQVINSKQTLLLKKGAKFTRSRLNALMNHEIGVHMVTTKNANMQPLKFLSLGLPRNTYTQEGLAILSEYKSGCLTITRLKELAFRVLAVDSLTKGNDFKTTFETLHDIGQMSTEKLFYLVTRIYRGGGFTKDYLYLSGFRRVLELSKQGANINNLLLGKTNDSYLPVLNELVDRGILNKPQYFCRSFEEPIEVDPILKYLTDSIHV